MRTHRLLIVPLVILSLLLSACNTSLISLLENALVIGLEAASISGVTYPPRLPRRTPRLRGVAHGRDQKNTSKYSTGFAGSSLVMAYPCSINLFRLHSNSLTGTSADNVLPCGQDALRYSRRTCMRVLTSLYFTDIRFLLLDGFELTPFYHEHFTEPFKTGHFVHASLVDATRK